MAEKSKLTSKSKTKPVDVNERTQGYIRELTALQAHADALALAVESHGAEGFRDNELSAALFDIEERLMYVRDGFASLPVFSGKGAQHG